MIHREHNEVFKKIWKIKALPSMQHFAWKVLLVRVATKDNLTMRGILIGSTLCVMCSNDEESVSHLLFTCNVAQSVWKQCLRWVGITSVNHNIPQHNFS